MLIDSIVVMATRMRFLLKVSAAATLMLMAVFFVVRYRFVRVERIDVVDKEVYSILEQTADSLAMNSSKRNNALFLSSTRNSFNLSSRIPCVFDPQWGTAGMTKIKGVRVYLDMNTFNDDIPDVFAHTGKKSTVIVLSENGINHDLNHYGYDEHRINSFFKLIDGHWANSTYEEFSNKEYEIWLQEHPDTLDFKTAIPPSFTEKYKSLDDSNFRLFLSEWIQWSHRMNSLSTDSLLNSTLTNVISEYRKDIIDTCSLLSFDDNIEIRKYQGNHNDYPIDQDGFGSNRDVRWEYMMKASERYCYVPSIYSDKGVLYITPRIQRLLSLYIGGVCESDEDDFMDYEKWTEINEGRLSDLRKLIHVDRGHWGGHWHFKTMPIVYSIYFFDDGYVVDMRTSWWSGETVFYPSDSSQEKEVIDGWIE